MHGAPGGAFGDSDLNEISRKCSKFTDARYPTFKSAFEATMRTRELANANDVHPDKNGYIFKWRLGLSYLVFVRGGYIVSHTAREKAGELLSLASSFVKRRQLNTINDDELNLQILRILKERDDYLTRDIPQKF